MDIRQRGLQGLVGLHSQRFPDDTKSSHKTEDSFPDKMNVLNVSFTDPKCSRLTFPYFNFFFERERESLSEFSGTRFFIWGDAGVMLSLPKFVGLALIKE